MAEAYFSLEQGPREAPPCVLTIGNFDGVHLGHQKILRLTAERAREQGLIAAALTFDPHPTRVVAPERAPALMTTPADRIRRFAKLGIETVWVLPFTAETAALAPEEFVARVLVERLRARRIIVGGNFRFGRRQQGDVAMLAELGRRWGFDVETVEPVLAGGQVVSSSRIRKLLAEGKAHAVRALLGDCFRLRGERVAGRGIGARQTVPTVNLTPETELLPGDGVYISEALDLESDRRWPSVTNVGVRPTFGGGDRTVETHLLEDLEGEGPARLEIVFYRRLRGEARFASAVELRGQILRDIARARLFFHRLRLATVSLAVPAREN